MGAPDPNLDVAHMAHVELLTPRPAETLAFFTDLLGMQESGRDGRSVYLRAYEEHYHHSLKLTEAPAPGLGHIAWRTRSAAALERQADALQAAGHEGAWIDGDLGHGRCFRFQSTDGHPMELVWDVRYCDVPPGERTKLRNRPQRRPLRGVPVRRIDHVNCYAADLAAITAFLSERLGFRVNELYMTDARDAMLGSWLSVTNLSHDIGIFGDPTGARGRLHHVAYYYGTPQHLNDAVEMFHDVGVEIEAGPAKHGLAQGNFLYVFEPGGNRVELWGDAGLLIFDPSREPVVWTESEVNIAGAWIGGRDIPPSFFHRGSPPAELPDLVAG